MQIDFTLLRVIRSSYTLLLEDGSPLKGGSSSLQVNIGINIDVVTLIVGLELSRLLSVIMKSHRHDTVGKTC